MGRRKCKLEGKKAAPAPVFFPPLFYIV